MCMVCRQYPCNPGCPNAPEPRPLLRCRQCGAGLYGGDKHFEGICEECLSMYSVTEWLEMFGEDLEEVEDEKWAV